MNTMASRRYCLITPCRDEAKYARRTLESITRQTLAPARWIIVDDGSSDETPALLKEYAARFDYIQIVRREDRGVRSVGPGVIDAFYAGYDAINPDDFEYICKLDLDLDIPPGYFQEMIQRMEANPRLGTCSGKPYFPDPKDPSGKTLISEACGDEMSVGMVKFYRTRCFKQIGGFVRQVMWDGIDCHRCRMLGWIACSWDEPSIRFIHLRPMGTSHKGWWTGRVRHGMGQYFMGTSLPYMLASGLFRMTRPPIVVGGLAMIWGYLRNMLKGVQRYDDLDFRTFLRRYQWACLLKGKTSATQQVDRERATNWKPEIA
jgi:glycosyltransferase involved in cell wall biosynthesis